MFLCFVMILCFWGVSSAETVVLNSGKNVEGKLIEKTDKYIKIDFLGVPLTYFSDEVATINGKSFSEYAPAEAQDQQAEGHSAAGVNPEKKALILELLEVTNMENTFQNVMQTTLLQIRQSSFERIARALAANDKLTVEQKEQIKQEAEESWDRVSARFNELFPQKINLKEHLREIAVPLYDKYYTTDELRDVVNFYKTPTGRKMIRIMPQLMAESMQRFEQVLNPKMRAIMQEILQEEEARQQQNQRQPGQEN